MATDYGASLEAWHHWSETLGLTEHLLPVVANPGATISPDSNMTTKGKTPSRYNFRREVAGFAKWTDHRTTHKEVGKWELERDYGICVQAREIRAIDIDVPNIRKSRAIVEALENCLPLAFFPKRSRENTGKVLLPFRYEGELYKRVLNVEGGIVEVLADGQQWIAESSYIDSKTGKVNGRYMWPGGWPKDFPELSREDLGSLFDMLEMLFAVPDDDGECSWLVARERRKGQGVDLSPVPGGDPVQNWLIENWEIREDGRDGELYIRCPFDSEHSSDSGPTETVYYPAGTGGYVKGHFKCLHAHCMKREDDDYLEALGYRMDPDEFPELPAIEDEVDDTPSPETLPRTGTAVARFMTDTKGRKENRVYNHELFLRTPEMCGKQLAWDNFTANIVWCPAADKQGEERWKVWSDEHYAQVVRQMDRHGFVPISASSIRPAVHSVAMANQIDTALEWANRLPKWDGVERIETFLPEYLKTVDSEYTRAVGLYMWTAQAGRLLDPGCQVDMVPIFVSEQGTRKTSLIRALAPASSMFTDINLMDRDGDTTRKMRGKLVIELDELRGLRGRAVEDVKSFITRREEEWVPKYMEFTKTFQRRFVMYGSTNEDDFLGDPTGERRYLPVEVGMGNQQLSVEELIEDRTQLWAEAIAVWKKTGIAWGVAERLAPVEHTKFKKQDAWERLVRGWLLAPGGLDDPELAPADCPNEWGLHDVLSGAVNIPASKATPGDEVRMGRVLRALGCIKKRGRQGTTYRAYRAKLEGENG